MVHQTTGEHRAATSKDISDLTGRTNIEDMFLRDIENGHRPTLLKREIGGYTHLGFPIYASSEALVRFILVGPDGEIERCRTIMFPMLKRDNIMPVLKIKQISHW